MNSLLQGALFGFGAAVPIGQVNVEIVRRTLRDGFWDGFVFGLGACSVDVMYAVLTAGGVGPLLSRPAIQLTLGWTSVVVLSYLGGMCIRAAFRSLPGEPPTEGTPEVSGLRRPQTAYFGHGRARLFVGYFSGLMLTIVNPMTIVFWLGVAGSAASEKLSLNWVCVGVFAATITWVAFFTTTVSVLRQFNQRRWLPVADGLGGATLIFFAARTVWRLTHPHL